MTTRLPDMFPTVHVARVSQRTSLVTFADMVMALDHTYASGNLQTERGCAVRRNDHTYSTTSRHCRPSTVAKACVCESQPGDCSSCSTFFCPDQPHHSARMRAFGRKSSSEENLSRTTITMTDHRNCDGKGHSTLAQKSFFIDGMCTVQHASGRKPKSASNANVCCAGTTPQTLASLSGPQREDHTYATLTRNRSFPPVDDNSGKSEDASGNIADFSAAAHSFADHTYDGGMCQAMHSLNCRTSADDHNYHSFWQAGGACNCYGHSIGQNRSNMENQLAGSGNSVAVGHKAFCMETFGFTWIMSQDHFTSFDHNYSTSV
ncbi:hypothetical protein BaRGS_00012238 [Batillaria attramentaria]|uniref:Uncharacterized protein n=1 Tax=Batillaria attramentaria TaxID=370345 RepID=A0ABD0LAJ6_9CAEN